MKKLNFIGIGGATNVDLGGNCCYLKEKDNLLIIDMCESATEKLKRLNAFKGVKNIYIVITHTHFDHIAGLGVFIWYCNFHLNLKPKILFSDNKYKTHLKKILKLTGVDEKYVDFINGKLFSVGSYPGLPYLLIIAAIFGVIFWFIYNKTTHGKYMYAIGGNESAAEVSGVNTRLSKICIYVIAGVMYALAGYLLAGKTGGATSSMGNGYELEAIAGCTIGGVSTTGGIGTVGGILVGVLVFELLKIVLQFLGVNPYYNYIAQGLVIVVAVALDIRKYVKRK